MVLNNYLALVVGEVTKQSRGMQKAVPLFPPVSIQQVSLWPSRVCISNPENHGSGLGVCFLNYTDACGSVMWVPSEDVDSDSGALGDTGLHF